MATTYELITSTTLTSTATSITLSSIPATYTDLAIICSVRCADGAYSNLMYSPNSTNANANAAEIYGQTSTTSGTIAGYNQPAYVRIGTLNSSGQPTYLFNMSEIYIPNYLAATSKSSRGTNMSYQYHNITSGTWADSAAINAIKIFADGSTMIIGSSVYIYGILKA